MCYVIQVKDVMHRMDPRKQLRIHKVLLSESCLLIFSCEFMTLRCPVQSLLFLIFIFFEPTLQQGYPFVGVSLTDNVLVLDV